MTPRFWRLGKYKGWYNLHESGYCWSWSWQEADGWCIRGSCVFREIYKFGDDRDLLWGVSFAGNGWDSIKVDCFVDMTQQRGL